MVDRIERLLGRIPGYDAYNRKESMRDDDRRLREQIASRLDQSVAALTKVSSRLATERQLGAIGAVENLVRDVRHLGDRVRTASYGYEGLFSDRKVDEFALSQLKAFDVAFDVKVDALASQIATIGTSSDTPETQVHDVGTQVDELGRLFDARNEVITTATPVNDPNVLSLLDTPITISPEEQRVLRVRSGGTIAILGDNFQVTGHIIIKNRNNDDVTLALLRLDQGADWLAVTRTVGVRCWKVQETTSDPSSLNGTDGSASVSGPQGTQDDVPAKYDVQVSTGGDSPSATIRIALGGNVQAYAGAREVPLIDIEVYSDGTTA